MEEREHLFYRTAHPLPPKWEYEPTEMQVEQLIRVYGRNSKRAVRVGFGRPAPETTKENLHG